jgi:hypothetical protein
MDLSYEKLKSLTRTSIQSLSPSYLAGLVSGLSNAGLFNWYDKALYESMKHNRPFLHLDNFRNPWQGFQAAIVGRVLSYGMFFPIAESCENFYKSYSDNPEIVRFLSSQSTGMLICLPLAPISAIKYRMWGSHHGYIDTSIKMYHHGGMVPFFQGIVPTLWRDCCWASAFVFTKHHGVELVRSFDFGEGSYAALIKSSCEFSAVTMAGMIATAASSPFNYVRNLVYSSHHSKKIPGVWKSIGILFCEARTQREMSYFGFLQHRLNVGFGTARVAIGMAVSNKIYEYSKSGIDGFQKSDMDICSPSK